MKKMLIAGLVVLSGTLCWADSAPATSGKNEPCKQIVRACESAGYLKGMHKKDGKGLYMDCLNPILAGQSVSGVTVDASVVSACNERKAKRQVRKAAAGGAPATTPAAK